MRGLLALTVALISLGLAAPPASAAGEEGGQIILLETLSAIDGSIISLRQGDPDGAKASLQRALDKYSGLSRQVRDVNSGLDDQVKNAFKSLIDSPNEEGIRGLRADVIRAAGRTNVEVPFIYQYAMFVILIISASVAALVSLLTKRSIDWPTYMRLKSELAALRKEMLDARRRQDVKRIYKLTPRFRELSAQMMGITLRQTFVVFLIYLPAFFLLGSIYGGWVVAWLPFGLPELPFIGSWVSAGYLSWLIITYFGFSTIFRKLAGF